MLTSLFLSKVRHKAMTTAISLLCTNAVELISGSSSGHLNFLASARTSRGLCLRLHNNLVQKIRKKHCIICIIRLPNKLSLWIRNLNLWPRGRELFIFGHVYNCQTTLANNFNIGGMLVTLPNIAQNNMIYIVTFKCQKS